MSLLDRLRNWLRPKPPTPPVPPPPPPPPGPQPGSDALALHNAERVARDRRPFTSDPRLDAAAQRHAEWMARTGRLTHNGDGTPFSRINQAGYQWSWAGENIAEARDPVTAMRMWMNSPDHRDNIVSPNFTQMGYGQAGGYSCAVFARPA